MTIVETAMERARELTNGVAPSTGNAPILAPVHRPAPVAPALIGTQPHTPIKAKRLHIDARTCRENRLLLSATDEGGDGAAVAAYRMLRTRILHRIRARKWVTIGVTSAGPNEGKTLTALNLSFSLARERNSEVVLLDLDMRNPSICKMLDVEPPRELRHFFESPSDPKDLFFSIGVENLLIAGHTSASEHASELLASTRFEDLVSHVRQSTANPIVLIDLPPVLSTDDALVLAPRLDALLLVVAEGKTDRGDLQRATELLSEFSVAGLVLNQSSGGTGRYAYGYGGNYGAY
jgi:capsular exopolysaccharide synthesis family protein